MPNIGSTEKTVFIEKITKISSGLMLFLVLLASCQFPFFSERYIYLLAQE